MVQSVENDSVETTGCLIDYVRRLFTCQANKKNNNKVCIVCIRYVCICLVTHAFIIAPEYNKVEILKQHLIYNYRFLFSYRVQYYN